MSKRCRQCGRPLGKDEGEFCSSGCRHQFERENPGQLKRESKGELRFRIIAVIILIIVLAWIVSKTGF